MGILDRRTPCDVVGCKNSTTFAGLLEKRYGLTLCDPAGSHRSSHQSRTEQSHYLQFSGLHSHDVKLAERWIEENCTVEFACGHRGKPRDDYLCEACRG